MMEILELNSRQIRGPNGNSMIFIEFNFMLS